VTRSPPLPPIGQPALAQSLSRIWSVIHAEARFSIRESEIHYLTGIALGLDDDVLAHMLLKKLKMAAVEKAVALPGVVTMNSFVEFTFAGPEKRFGQLVHPSSANGSYALSVASREGAGILGMHRGQTILWPNKDRTLADLQVLSVEQCPALGDR